MTPEDFVRPATPAAIGYPLTAGFAPALERNPEGMDQVLQSREQDTMLKRLPSIEDIANTSVFLAGCRD